MRRAFSLCAHPARSSLTVGIQPCWYSRHSTAVARRPDKPLTHSVVTKFRTTLRSHGQNISGELEFVYVARASTMYRRKTLVGLLRLVVGMHRLVIP